MLTGLKMDVTWVAHRLDPKQKALHGKTQSMCGLIDSAIQTGKKFGMQLLDDHLWSLYSKGMISAEEMIDVSKNPVELTARIHRLGRTVGRMEWDEESEEGKPAS